MHRHIPQTACTLQCTCLLNFLAAVIPVLCFHFQRYMCVSVVLVLIVLRYCISNSYKRAIVCGIVYSFYGSMATPDYFTVCFTIHVYSKEYTTKWRREAHDIKAKTDVRPWMVWDGVALRDIHIPLCFPAYRCIYMEFKNSCIVQRYDSSIKNICLYVHHVYTSHKSCITFIHIHSIESICRVGGGGGGGG